MKKICLLLCLLPVFCGCRVLPDKNYLGMDRSQVIAAVADTPKWRDQYWVMVPELDSPLEKNRIIPSSTLYFTTIDQLGQDPSIQKTTVLALDYHPHWSGPNFYYVLTLKDNIVVRQQTCGLSDDGLNWPCFYRFTNLDAKDELPDNRVIEIAQRAVGNPGGDAAGCRVERDSKYYLITFKDAPPIRIDRQTLQIKPSIAEK